MDGVTYDYSRFPQVSGELFRRVQSAALFEDDKTFVDARPRVRPDVILERYFERRCEPDFDLEGFVEEHFQIPASVDYEGDDSDSMAAYVDRVWGELTKRFDGAPPHDGTLVSLPNEHVVPGDRFRESYYWDSYFIAVGLAASDRVGAVEAMVENFASLIEDFGFIPLGNRVYYDSRSQVPLFYRTLQILERERGFEAVEPYLPHLETEYAFWMEGADVVSEGDQRTHERVVRVDDGLANRYWDGRTTPRPESASHDRQLAARVPVDDRPDLFRDIRAACESGWDFSTRWLEAPDDMTTIRTTDLLPVDLNALLYEIEAGLAEWVERAGDPERASEYRQAAEARRTLVETHFWDDDRGFYVDYDWVNGTRSDALTLAGVVPLFTGLASPKRADRVATRLRTDFLAAGGLPTTLESSAQQWDMPNGWAPLQWMAVVGLLRYDQVDLAREIADRWMDTVRTVFEATGTMQEKYDVRRAGAGAEKGEYAQQFGFGWTNGVTIAFQRLSAEDVRSVERR